MHGDGGTDGRDGLSGGTGAVEEHGEGLPPRGGTVVRSTGRMLPVRPDGRVLLLRGSDPDTPEDRYWFTVGGGTDPGESHLDAAVRELAEETGLVVDAADVTAELGRYNVEFGWAGRRIVQDLVFFAVAVPADAQVRLDGVSPLERASIDSHDWLTPDELGGAGHEHDERLAGMLRLAVSAVLGTHGRP